MTVKELMEKLQNLDPSMLVLVGEHEGERYLPIIHTDVNPIGPRCYIDPSGPNCFCINS